MAMLQINPGEFVKSNQIGNDGIYEELLVLSCDPEGETVTVETPDGAVDVSTATIYYRRKITPDPEDQAAFHARRAALYDRGTGKKKYRYTPRF